MKKIVHCAVLGLGRLGYLHAKNLSKNVIGAKLVAVVDSLEGRAEKVAKELDVPYWSQCPDDVFNNPEIDAVVIVTPTNTHHTMIKKAASSGKHIFVEKPITRHLVEVEDVIKVIQKNNVFCQVGFMRRFDPSYVEAKRRIEAGDIGKPIYFKGITRDGKTPPPGFIKSSGGLYLDFSIHDFDMARFLLGSEVATVKAVGTVVQHKYVEEFGDVDQALTFLTFNCGAAADIEASRNASYGYDIRTEVIGTEGAIQIGSLKQHDLKILKNNSSSHDIFIDFPSQFRDAFLAEMISFIDSIVNNRKPSVNEIDGKKALEIAVAATESYKKGTLIKLQTES